MDICIISKKVAYTFRALSHRNFRLFWVGQCISLIGTWMQNIGQSWLVLQITGSAFKLGLISAMQFLPMMLFALLAGALVDRLPKRKVLLFTQTSLMVLALVLASLTWFKAVQYWHILVLATLLGIINTLDMPTRQSFFIELVGKDDLSNGIALNSAIFNLARIVGPAVAGFLIGLLGIAVCFYLNALSFVAVIIGIWMMKLPPATATSGGKNGFRGTLHDIKDGLKYIASTPVILLPLVLLAVISTFAMNYNVVVPIFAKQNLAQNAMGFGFLMTSMGIGSFIGALTLAARGGTESKFRELLGGALGMSVFMIILGFTKTYYLACVLLLVIGFCSITFTASVNTTIQLNSLDYMRGRVMSVYSLVFGGVIPIGSLYAGRVIESAGTTVCFVISGAIGLGAAIIVMLILHKNHSLEIRK